MWAMGALPELAPSGEDHLLRSSSIVRQVEYSKRALHYNTFDADGTEVLRLSYRPARIEAGGVPLSAAQDLKNQGYTVAPLPGGDYVVRIRHVASGDVRVTG